MREAISDATKIFCEEILGFELKKAKTLGSDFYVASIPIYENENEKNWFLLFKRQTLQKIAQALLFEDNISEEDIDDLIKEVSNQIIGLAKVTLEEKNPNFSYKLGVPDFLGTVSSASNSNSKNSLLYKICNRTFLITDEKQKRGLK